MLLQRFAVPAVALVIASLAAYAARNFIQARQEPVVAVAAPAPAPAPEIKFKEVLVAAAVINPGNFLGQHQFRWQKWPDVDVPDTYFVKGRADMSAIDGAVARLPILAGDPILKGSFVRPGDRGFLAAVLDADMRAVSVPVDEASSNAGLIQPGDHVDLILTQSIAQNGNFNAGRHVSETVLENLRVIAMGRNLQSIQPGNGDGQRQARTATLEVTPAGAEKVALVTELGKLSLSLRSLAESGAVQQAVAGSEPFTWDSDVSAARRAEKLAIIRGNKTENVGLINGGQ